MSKKIKLLIGSRTRLSLILGGFVLLLGIGLIPMKGVWAVDSDNEGITLGNTGVVISGDIIRHSGHVIYGTPTDDTIVGSSHDDKINADFGNDYVKGNGGDDIIQGGGGSDKLYGNKGADYILGGFGDDLIIAGSGNDKLLGGPDDDTLIGGPGADYFNCGDGQDQIVDFNPSQGDTRTQDCEVINTV
jgi:Ca2+-binding RTX toxin-like protein